MQHFAYLEMDTIIGENNQGAILTMVERTTAFMLMEKLEKGKKCKRTNKGCRQITNSIHKQRTHHHN